MRSGQASCMAQPLDADIGPPGYAKRLQELGNGLARSVCNLFVLPGDRFKNRHTPVDKPRLPPFRRSGFLYRDLLARNSGSQLICGGANRKDLCSHPIVDIRFAPRPFGGEKRG